MARRASRAPGPCVLLRRNAGESSRPSLVPVWLRVRVDIAITYHHHAIAIKSGSLWPVGLVAPPAPAFSFVETPGSPPAQIWCRCGRCCGFKSTSQSRITIMQSQSRASSSWPVGLVVPPAPAFSFVETPGSPPPKFGTGVVAGSSRHRNHVSPSCNHTIKSV